MGSVWLAKNEVTDREFAIKLLLPQAAEAPMAMQRFLREARVCGALRHPSILEIYDAGAAPELGGAPYLVMERLDGAALDVVLRLRGALAPRLALDIVVQISRGRELAHEKGIVHRDLKPANVYLHRPGSGALEPKVLDFGISKIISLKAPEVALTNTAAILGSPIYMSPEQMGAAPHLDARSDVHALGVLLWELLTGKAPFAAESYNLLVVEIMKGPRPLLHSVMPGASKRLAAIVERAFAIEPNERFASAALFADALDAELTELGGPVLGSRTAAADVLGGLDLCSKAPPPMHGSTTEPLSHDPRSGQSPSSAGGAPRASATSFAETELAAVPQAAAVSVVRDAATNAGKDGGPPREARDGKARSLALRAAGAVVVAAVAAGATVVATRRPQPPTASVSAEPPSTAPIDTNGESAGVLPARAPIDAGAPATPPLPSSAASVAPSPAPAPAKASAPPPPSPRPALPPATPKKPGRPSGTPPSQPGTRPKIDESGL